MSLRAFARDRGVNHSSVSKAARTGRLSACLGQDGKGRPVITDVKLAREEWRANAGRPPNAGRRPEEAEAQTDDLTQETADVLVGCLRYVLHGPGRRFVTEHADGRLYYDAPGLLDWLEAEEARR